MRQVRIVDGEVVTLPDAPAIDGPRYHYGTAALAISVAPVIADGGLLRGRPAPNPSEPEPR